MQVWEMALSLFAVNNNYMDDVEVSKALAFEKSLRDFVKSKYASLVDSIDKVNNLSDADEKALHAAVADFKKTGAY